MNRIPRKLKKKQRKYCHNQIDKFIDSWLRENEYIKSNKGKWQIE